ncbi:MAG: TorF family putative porin [Caldimonas sp.]
MKKSSIAVSSLLSLAAASVFAQATPPAPEPSPFTANLNLATKYKFRGQDQGNDKFLSPAFQGGFDWSANGWYLGNWNSNIGFTNTGIEMDFYGGYRGEISKDFGYDVGLLEYYYPSKDMAIQFNTLELYGALTWQWLTVKYSHTVSKDYFGNGQAGELLGLGYKPSGRHTGYLEANANFPLVDKLTLNAHAGYTRYSSDLRNARTATVDNAIPNYFDYKLGVTYDLGSGFSIAGAVVGASKRSFYKTYFGGSDVNKTTAIFTLSKVM